MKRSSKSIGIVIFLISNFIIAQKNESLSKESYDTIATEILNYQNTLNEEFSNAETTILDPEDFEKFESLEFYHIDLKFKVIATFIRTPDEKPFLMKTTTDRLPEYVKYGEAHFEIDKKEFKLNIYKSTKLVENHEEDYVFLPFTDLTSGDGSYGGGRYLDLDVPHDKTMIVDFNKSYNPYCAYSYRFSCPIPPEENDLKIRIEAGVMDYGKH